MSELSFQQACPDFVLVLKGLAIGLCVVGKMDGRLRPRDERALKTQEPRERDYDTAIWHWDCVADSQLARWGERGISVHERNVPKALVDKAKATIRESYPNWPYNRTSAEKGATSTGTRKRKHAGDAEDYVDSDVDGDFQEALSGAYNSLQHGSSTAARGGESSSSDDESHFPKPARKRSKAKVGSKAKGARGSKSIN